MIQKVLYDVDLKISSQKQAEANPTMSHTHNFGGSLLANMVQILRGLRKKLGSLLATGRILASFFDLMQVLIGQDLALPTLSARLH